MTGTVHALLGAAVGSLFKKKSSAFAAGVVSHVITDIMPHNDVEPALDAPVMAATIAVLGKRLGFDSPEFWGAIGAIAPDMEHGLLVAGVIEQHQEVFPTHKDNGKFHGPKSNERWSQFALAIGSLAVLALGSANRGNKNPGDEA